MQKLRSLERRLTAAGPEGLNDLQQFYSFCESSNLEIVAEALQGLGRTLAHHRRVFQTSPAVSGEEEKEKAVGAFLAQHTDAFHSTLVELASSSKSRAQVCAIRLVFFVIRGEAEEAKYSNAAPHKMVTLSPPNRRVTELLSALLVSEHWSTAATTCLMEEFVERYVDLRHYVAEHLKGCAESLCFADAAKSSSGTATAPSARAEDEVDEQPDKLTAPKRHTKRTRNDPFVALMQEKGRSADEIFARLLSLIKLLPAPEPQPKAAPTSAAAATNSLFASLEEDAAPIAQHEVLAPMGMPTSFFTKNYSRLFQDTWLQLLSLRVPLEHYTPLLQLVPNQVMPHITSPLMLADFYLRAFGSVSAEVSVLSLSGLLVLLTQHGLADPEALSTSSNKFYVKLYTLMKASTFELKRRARFQRLLVASLFSGLLPARFAAVFSKRALQVALEISEPSTIMWLMSVAYSLIQKHHSHCKQLLSRPTAASTNLEPDEARSTDSFDPNAGLDDALNLIGGTSLWELQVLRRHHIAGIATLASAFMKPFFKPSSKKLEPESFLDQSFQKVFLQALKKGQRQATKIQAAGDSVPVNFRVEDDEVASKVFGWAAALSTSERQVTTQKSSGL
mmetsp:Transcript_70650/g.148010  ORF Transcript_70650/g.148010 Transcript_70650/m.148010 type:complete len:619 (+) Transcript_70650:61-1917(+)